MLFHTWVFAVFFIFVFGGYLAFHHPRLVPQFWPRIKSYEEKVDVKLGILLERRVPFVGLIRHILSNYYENTSVQKWMVKYPYRNPLAYLTFESAPVLGQKQGKGISWEQKDRIQRKTGCL